MTDRDGTFGQLEQSHVGDLLDTIGIDRKVLHKFDYLTALYDEAPSSRDELARIWSPTVRACAAAQDEAKAQNDAAGGEPPPCLRDPGRIEAMLAPLSAATGQTFRIPREKEEWERYLWPPLNDPAMVAVSEQFAKALEPQARWMTRYALPLNDFTWCFICVAMGFDAAINGRERTSTRIARPATREREPAPPLALGDIMQWQRFWDQSQIPPFPHATGDGLEVWEWWGQVVGGPCIRAEVPFYHYPHLETREAAEARHRAALDKAIAEQSEQLGSWATAQKTKRPPTKTSGLKHFRWFVRYQVHGQSMGAIAKDVRYNRQELGRVLKSIADLIDVPLRDHDPPGRPKGARTVNRVLH